MRLVRSDEFWKDVEPPPSEPVRPEDLTCHECPCRGTCEFVDDLYNTNGDCLAEK